MKLSQYISSVGDAAAAELFGVEERTAASWRKLTRSPRPEKAREIVKATKGKVSFSDCYEEREVAA
jgi:DNA-binding transcriptional regulator YdaS (Cro superfamily)